MKKIFLLVVFALFVLSSACADYPGNATRRISELKSSGHDKFTLIGKSVRDSVQILRFANDSGVTVSCHNLRFEYEQLKPSIDGTGDIFILDFRDLEPNVWCYAMRSGNEEFGNSVDADVLQYYNFVPIKKN